MKIENVKIYGMEESFKACGLPKLNDNPSRELVQRLGNAPIGSGHDNFLNGVIVQFDLTASNKFWVQLQRYHFMDFVSSTSTMHKINVMPIRKMCNSYVDPIIINRCEELQERYIKSGDNEDFLKLVYSIPSGFEVMARMTTNLRQLKTIYYQRKNHRLPEWKKFCEWIKTLPNKERIKND